VAAVPATLVGLVLLWRLEVESLVWLLHHFPPPRPMFCNDFVDDDRALLPYWYPPVPDVDRLGHWAWADRRDNVLLVVATGVPKPSRLGALASGPQQCMVRVGDDREDRFVTLRRTRDALVVVLPDGSLGQFGLTPGLAEQFDAARRSRRVNNLLWEAGGLLEPGEKAEFDKFLAGYREPEPEGE
jgi:hypothetical protein